MSKYEHFVNMKSNVILIILGFIQLVFCNHDLNITDDLYSVCPVELFRRKRAYPDYTRWRSDEEPTNEFLVKVLDEDLTTPKPVVAINILPATIGGDRLIIGGVKIPSPTTLMSLSDPEPREYTRFVPPTTTRVGRMEDVQIVPITHTTTIRPIMQSLQPQGYYIQRDDSPPASPQFIARTPVLVARQYAPIEPVAFNRRSTFGPSSPLLPNFHTFQIPTRTTYPALTASSQKKLDFEDYHQQYQTMEKETTASDQITRTSYDTPGRTSVFEFSSVADSDSEFEPTTKKLIDIEDSKRRYEEIKKVAEKDSESSYNMMFYNDDDTISPKKEEKEDKEEREEKEEVEGDYDKKGSKDYTLEPDLSESTELIDDIENKKTTSSKELNNYVDDYGVDNTTGKQTGKGIFGIPGIEIATLKTVPDKFRNKRRPFCSLLKLRQLNFNSPRTLPEIITQLKVWAEDSPVAKWVDITDGNYTTMENPIYMMIVDDLSSGQIITSKQTVMIVAGIQGRDHHAVAAAMYVLYQLIERSEAHADLLTKYRFWVIPVFNPDGYDYSMTFPHRREWTKNLHQQWDLCKTREACRSCENFGLRCTIQPCFGVNLDRNFEYQWIPAEERRLEHPCGGLYAGSRQLSEVETRALTHFLHEQRTPLFTFIAFKEGDVLGIMYPYSHTKKKRAFDHVYRQRASKAAAAAYTISNRPYMAGQTSEFLPLYAGGIEDWVDSHLGIDNTYTIMMFRPTDSYNLKLITERVVHETYAAMDTLLLQSLEPLGPAPVVPMARSGHCENILPNLSLYYITLYFTLLLNG